MKHMPSSNIAMRCLISLLVAHIVFCSQVLGQNEISPASAGVPLTETSTKLSVGSAAQSLPVSAVAPEQKNQNICLPHEYSLNNGLKIILLQDKAYPLISCFAWYNVGSRDDPAGMTGLSHLVEHLLFQNFGTFTKNQWANSIVRVGGEFSGFTSEDFTAFYSNLPSYQLELAIRSEAQRMSGAHFTQADVSQEIEHLVKEAQAEDQDMPLMLNREVHALAYERHPYRNPPGGWQHELERLTYNDAKAHYDRFFHPNNASLVLVGGFDEQNVLKLIEKYFGSIPKSDNLKAGVYTAERPQLAERQIKLKSRTGKEFVELAYKVSGINDADAPVISVLEQVLNGLMRSKLVDAGFCTSAKVAFEQKRDSGLLVVKCSGITPNGSAKLIQAIDTQFEQLKTKLLAESDVKQAAQQTEFAYYQDGDGPYGSAFQLGFFATLAQGEMAYLWPKKLRQVSAADILRVATRYLNEENRVLGEIAVVTPSIPADGKKVELKLPVNRSLIKSNNIISHAMSNAHLRLAAYQSGAMVAYAVSPTNSSSAVQPGVQTTEPSAAKSDVLPAAQSTESAITKSSIQPLAQTSAVLNSTVGVNEQKYVAKPPATENLALAGDNKPEQARISHKVLRNGLNIFVMESHLKPLVQVIGSVKAGSIYERPNFRGMSKLMATVLNAGDSKADKQQNTIKQSDILPPQAGALKFDSESENILFRINCLTKQFGDQMQTVFSILREPRLDNTNFDLAKCDVALSLRRNEKKPQVKIERALLKGLVASNCAYYPVHPEEEVNSMANFKLDDLKDFYSQHFNPASTTLVICGDVKTDEVFAMCELLSEGWILESHTNAAMAAASSNMISNKRLPPPKLLISNRESFKSSLILPQLNPAQIVLGRIIPVSNLKQTENYWAAMLIADCALSSHPIVSRVGEQFELNPDLSDGGSDQIWDTNIFKLADKLIWSMHIYLKPKSSSSTAVTAIQSALAEFSKLGLRQEEILEAKRYLIGHIPVKDCSNLDGLSQFIFRGVSELNEIEPMSRVQRIISGLKYEDINEFIAKVFKPQLAAIVVAGPKELIRQVRPAPAESAEASAD